MQALLVFVTVSFASLLPAAAAMAQPLPCKAAQLIATEDRKESDSVEGGLGHHAMTIAIRNRSIAECVLDGEPVLTLSGEANRELAVWLCPNCGDYLFDVQPVERVPLKPNETAYLVLGYNINDGVGTCSDAFTIGIRLPKDAAALKVDVSQNGQAMRSCGKIDVTPFLSRPPVDGVLPQRAAP